MPSTTHHFTRLRRHPLRHTWGTLTDDILQVVEVRRANDRRSNDWSIVQPRQVVAVFRQGGLSPLFEVSHARATCAMLIALLFAISSTLGEHKSAKLSIYTKGSRPPIDDSFKRGIVPVIRQESVIAIGARLRYTGYMRTHLSLSLRLLSLEFFHGLQSSPRPSDDHGIADTPKCCKPKPLLQGRRGDSLWRWKSSRERCLRSASGTSLAPLRGRSSCGGSAWR